MRILYLVHQYFPRHVGGTELYTRGLVRRVRASGHEAMVATCHESPSGDPSDFHCEEGVYEGVPLVEIHFNLSVTEHPVRWEYDNPFAGGVISQRIATWNPHVVHVMHGMKLSGAALEACHQAGVPVVVSLCDYWFLCPRHTLLDHAGDVCSGPDRPGKCDPCVRRQHGFLRRPVGPGELRGFVRDQTALERRAFHLRKLLLRARRFVALSGFQKSLFVRNGYPAAAIEVVPHGLEIADLDEGTDPGAPPGESRSLRRIGFIGSLVPHKGAHVLLEALARIPRAPLECRVYGDLRGNDAYVDGLRSLARRDERVRLMGTFDPSRTGAVLRGLDVLAVPALWYENEPLIVKAALHLGLPILASRLGSLEELVREGTNGRLVPPNDLAAWSAALSELASSPPPAAAPTRMKSMDDNAREWLAIYEAEAGRQ